MAGIKLKLKETAVSSTGVTPTSLRQRQVHQDDAPISGRAAAVVDRAVSAWERNLGIKIDPQAVFEHMEKLRQWQTKPMRK